LLDSFDAERMPFARRLVQTTDRVFTFATRDGKLADFVRTRIAPLVLPPLFQLDLWRDFAFRAVSQISINYRACALNAGMAGQVRGGDRLPWVAGDFGDNYDFFDGCGWQAHRYGAPDSRLSQWGEARKTPVRFFPWRPEFKMAGLAPDAIYLLRPDSYIGLASEECSTERLDLYFTERQIQPAALTPLSAVA
jgi:hypothetical protein